MRRALNVVGALAAVVAVGSVQVHAQAGRYPAARHGGNYMHSFYFPPAPSSTPWAPSWAPDGESIAVVMSGSIWRVDPDTGVAEELIYSPDAYHAGARARVRAVRRGPRGLPAIRAGESGLGHPAPVTGGTSHRGLW